MFKTILPAVVLGISVLATQSASAQATRTWVAAGGNDADPCSRTAPCATFAGAIVKTFINGVINCIDPGAFGTVTITKSVTIDCTDQFGRMLASGTTGVLINIALNANDPLRSVVLRGLHITGTGASGSVGTSTGLNGIRVDQANAVKVENVKIEYFTQSGILWQSSVSGRLSVSNSTISNAATGITVTQPNTTSAIVAIMDTTVENSGNGINLVKANGNGIINAGIVNARVISNTGNGIAANATGGVNVNILNAMVIGNGGSGILADGANAYVQIHNSMIAANVTGLSRTNGGLINSFQSNVLYGNLSSNGTPSATLPSQ